MIDSSDLLIEKYIGEHALPKEIFYSWIKWKRELDFDEIIINTSDTNLIFTRFIDVSEDVYIKGQADKSKYIIKKEWIETDNFVGFVIQYDHVPNQEIDVFYTVEFIKNSKSIYNLTQTIRIIIPKLEILSNIAQLDIDYDNINVLMNIELKQIKFVPYNNLESVISIMHNNGLDVSVIPFYTNIIDLIKNPSQTKHVLKIKGKGNAIINLSFKYSDYMQNKYSTNTIEININKQIGGEYSIPIENITPLSVAPLVGI